MDWQVGDLAVFVGSVKKTAENAHRFFGRKSKRGEIKRVIGVVGPIYGEMGLIFANHERSRHPTGAWSELQYRKVIPDKHEACESEFVDLLKRAKRPVSA